MATTASSVAPEVGPVTSEESVRTTPSRGEAAFNIAIWILFTALWIGFFAALVANQAVLDDLWHRVRDLPLLIQGIIGVLFLPLAAGLWIWETSWLALVRIVLVLTLAWVNLYLFFPWRRAP